MKILSLFFFGATLMAQITSTPAQSLHKDPTVQLCLAAMEEPTKNFSRTQVLTDATLKRHQKEAAYGSLPYSAASFILACRKINEKANITHVLAAYDQWTKRRDFDPIALESTPDALLYIYAKTRNLHALKSLFLMQGDGSLSSILSGAVGRSLMSHTDATLQVCEERKVQEGLCVNLALACWDDDAFIPKMKQRLRTHQKHKPTATRVLNRTLQLFGEMGH